MPIVRVNASAVISAPPVVVYDLIADYHKGHPSILPPQYFQNVVVEAGGRGAGTRIRFTMKSYGVTKTCYASITEPEPSFDTAYKAIGFRGLIEALLVPPYLRKVYAAELQLLAERAVAAATHSK